MTMRWNDSTVAFLVCGVVFLAIIVAEALIKPVATWEESEQDAEPTP